METAVAPAEPIVQIIQPQIAAPIPAKRTPKPGPTELQARLANVQQAGGNQAIQRVVEASEAEPPDVERAPTTPQEDPAYQVVVGQMAVKAKHVRTPAKTPEEKRDETQLASRVDCRFITDTTYAHKNHLKKVEDVQPDDLTVFQFMAEFETTARKLAKSVPSNKSDEQKSAFADGQEKAKEDVTAQNKSHTEPLRNELLQKDPSKYKDNQKEEAGDYDVSFDDPGKVPAIKDAKKAAPKPEPKATVSLDDESRKLDDSLKNHDVQGQKIDIDESSLAFPVSGEKSFDEAGEAKRKAQAEIALAKPEYHTEEKGVIHKSQNDIHSLVNIQGLPGHHNLRAGGFKSVLEKQVFTKKNIKTRKQTIFDSFENIYNDTKGAVDTELAKLNDPEPLDKTFENILTETDTWFSNWITQAMEYIDPGFWGYSDWGKKNGHRIAEEYKRLIGEKYHDLDVAIDKLSEKYPTLGDIAKAFRSFGGGDWTLYFKAYSNIQEKSALEYFEMAKNDYIYKVRSAVERDIAPRVVSAINSARHQVIIGETKLDVEFKKLSPAEQLEVADVFQGIKDRFGELRTNIDERQHEITADMARTYNKSVGKLKAKFEEIKTYVFSSWLERAWAKIKAVINAIIEFATRLAELLGKMIGLLGDIISSPRAFFRNLVTGISEGFSTFVEDIDKYLATAFFDWIRGTSGVQVQLPKEWNAAGIFSLFTQLLNLSTETIWQRMEVVYDTSVANAFRKGEVALEKGLEIFAIVKEKGLGGLWDHIVESLGTLLSDTLDEMKETVLYAAIKKVLIEIGKMLVPGGGFIAIAEKVIRLLVFIVEARNKILDLIEAFVSSMENAVNGDIAGIVKLVTTGLTRFITVALDFLVTFFGLSSLKEKVERFIERMRSPIIRGIDFVLKKFKPLVMKGKELVVKGKEKVVGAGKQIVRAVRRWLGLEKKFVGNDGMEHKLYFAGSETSQVLMVRSNPTPYGTFIQSVEVGSDDKKVKAKALALPIARKIDEKRLEPLSGTTEEEKERSKEEKIIAVGELLDELAVPTEVLFGDPSAAGEPLVNHTTQAAGYGLAMTASKLNKKQKLKGSPPTGAMNNSYQILNNRRQEENPDVTYYVKGHLLNENVGGIGVWKNLTPLSRKGNSDHESKVESLVKAAFESGAVVQYNVTAVYGYGQNEGQIPDGDPKVAEKKRIIKEEVNVPTTLACEAFVMEKVDNAYIPKQTIVKADVNNPIGQNAVSYALSDSPVRETIYLNDADAAKIATIEGIDAAMAANIVLAHQKNKELYDSSRFNSYTDLADARKDRAFHRIFRTTEEKQKIEALDNLKYVKLYRGARGATAAGQEADISTVL